MAFAPTLNADRVVSRAVCYDAIGMTLAITLLFSDIHCRIQLWFARSLALSPCVFFFAIDLTPSTALLSRFDWIGSKSSSGLRLAKVQSPGLPDPPPDWIAIG